MGLIGRVKQYIRSIRNGENFPDIINNTGGPYDLTSKHYQPPGEDSVPLPNDLVVSVVIEKSGNARAVGFVDPVNPGVAIGGEVRRYARSPDGVIVSQIYQMGDGTIIIENDGVTTTIKPDGDHLIDNGIATYHISPDGTVETDNGGVNSLMTPSGQGKLSNKFGFIDLLENGVVSINGTLFSPTGAITMASAQGILMSGGGSLDLSSGGNIIFTTTTYQAHRHTETGTITSTPI